MDEPGRRRVEAKRGLEVVMAMLTGLLEDALDVSTHRLPRSASARAVSVARLAAVCDDIARLASTAALLAERAGPAEPDLSQK